MKIGCRQFQLTTGGCRFKLDLLKGACPDSSVNHRKTIQHGTLRGKND